MKKVILKLTSLIIAVMVMTTSAYAYDNTAYATDGLKFFSATMAINEDIVVFNGTKANIAPPVLVFNKTYVAVQSVAPYLNITAKREGKTLTVTHENSSLTFTEISYHDELKNPSRFFRKDDLCYISLRELTDFCNYELTYNRGIITVQNSKALYNSLFSDISTSSTEDYVYGAYPYKAEHIVYPYRAYSYETMLSDAEKLKNMYPELIKTSSIGKSVEGRDLLLIEFGKGKKKVFVCGTHHAREYIATTYLMYAIDQYAYCYRTGKNWGKYNPRSILDEITFCIVPMVNPDGVNLVQNGIESTQHALSLSGMGLYEGKKYGYESWKANVRGVDVNWNYDKDWSIERNKNGRGSSGFNGEYPNSEPETLAMTNYVDSNSFEAYLSFHTQGQIFYWADSTENPLYLQQAIKKDTGFSGIQETCTGVGGSFFDYVYRKFNKATITVELCPYVGNYPYPDRNFDTVWKPAKNILLLVGNEIIYRSNISK